MYELDTSIPQEIRERIIQAANSLYESSDKTNFPTVDNVRRKAKVDMNSASLVMKEWRKSQIAQATPIAVHVPDTLVQANHQALISLWSIALELANDSLRSAQAAWDKERAELEQIRKELAQAYEDLLLDFNALKDSANTTEKTYKESEKKAAQQLAEVKAELAEALTRAERAEAKIEEIERRVVDLRSELDRSHQEIQQARNDITKQVELTNSISAERDRANSEFTKLGAKYEMLQQANDEQKKALERDIENLTLQKNQAIQTASDAREHAAELSGKIVELKEQNLLLLNKLTDNSKTDTVTKA